MSEVRRLFGNRPISADKHRHSLAEDALGILFGAFLVSFGVIIYGRATLLVGGVIGIAQLLAYVTPIKVWLGLPLLNIPFFALAWLSKGTGFVLRTLLAVTLESAFTREIAIWMDIASIDPVFATLAGGMLIGVGLMCLFRHGTTLGGVGILGEYLQDRHGIKTGYVQLTTDGMILLSAAVVLPPRNLLLSIVGAAVTSGVLIVHHRSDRYVGVT